jgi:nucleoside-diphosphate-sugar epimerase
MTAGPSGDSAAAPVLVTGGGGFIGRAIVARLLERGQKVRVLGRGKYPDLAARGVECIRGDLSRPGVVEIAVRGCGLVFHVAAKAGVWGRWGDYYNINVRATRRILAACRRCGVPRLVFTSSPSVVFGGKPQDGVGESTPYPSRFRSHYSATKADAEDLVLRANDAELRTVALRPHLVWGPGDNHIVPRILAQGRAGRLRIIGDGTAKVDTTYIDNAADAHLAAADALEHRPEVVGGRAYFISNNEPVVVWEIINGILAAGGLPPVTKRVPYGAAHAIAGLMELAHVLLRRRGEPRMTRFVVEELATSHWFDITAARRDLGYEPKVTIAEGLQRLAEWLRARHTSELPTSWEDGPARDARGRG